jgi:transposase-like protein
MPSDEECAEVLREVRWAGGVMCVYCGGRSVVKRGWRGLYQRYKCKDCRQWFNDDRNRHGALEASPEDLVFHGVYALYAKGLKEAQK